jgi:hypothetical protein
MDQDHGPAGPELAEHQGHTPNDQGHTPDDQPRTPEQVREEIEQTRTELGDTVAALSAKTDVKGQTKHAVHAAKATVTGKAADIKETVTDRKQEFIASAEEATPDSVSDARQRATALAKQNSRALSVLAAFAVGLLIGRRTA